jgi:hypothetical protein
MYDVADGTPITLKKLRIQKKNISRRGWTDRVVPTPFQRPRMPSARQTWRTASENPFTGSVFKKPRSQTHTSCSATIGRARDDMLRMHCTLGGWQQTAGEGRVRTWTGWVCNRVLTTSKGVTGGIMLDVHWGDVERILARQRSHRRPCRRSDEFCMKGVHGQVPSP